MKKILKHIVAKLNIDISIEKCEKISSSNNNIVYKVGDYIIKLNTKFCYLENEYNVLNGIKGDTFFPYPVLFDNYDGYYFLVVKKINGETLDNYWLGYTKEKQKEVLDCITINLKKIHSYLNNNSQVIIGEKNIKSPNYYSILKLKIDNIYEKVLENPKVNKKNIHALITYFNNKFDVFKNETNCLVHNDLWYKNILSDFSGFKGIIDFELAMYAPKQIELFKIYNHLFTAKNYIENNPEDYEEYDFLIKFIDNLKENYKELFNYSVDQENVYKISVYFHMLSNFNESWYNHEEVEKYGKSINL